MELKTLRQLHSTSSHWIVGLLTVLSMVTLPPAVTAQESTETRNQTSVDSKIMQMEAEQEATYEGYFGRDLADVSQEPADIAATLDRLAEETGQRAAVLWVKPEETYLHLVLIPPDGEPIVRDIAEVPNSTLLALVQLFRREITDPSSRLHLPLGKRLHEWIIEPFETEILIPQEIDSLLVCLWSGMRSLPMAALYDGEQFLVEKYSVTTIPAFNLVEHRYNGNRSQSRILAMGASEFEIQATLPAVPFELQNIGNIFGSDRAFLNQDFTVTNLQNQLTQSFQDYAPIDIVHLATHATFQPGKPENSYIQFWDRPLRLSEMADISWNQPELDLLVLSACETALGNPQAELGFAGLALQAGVKSALASLWSVSDGGTLVLMSEFYQQLLNTPTKAEALRQAQLSLLNNEVQVTRDRLVLSRGTTPLPESLNALSQEDLSHPFFWAGFTLISSPW